MLIIYLIHNQNLQGEGVNEPKHPYKSGLPIDSIPEHEYDPVTQAKYTNLYQHLIGSLNWLAISTRPDISTVVNLLAKYMSKPSLGHIHAAKHVIKYLKGTQDMGITFTTTPQMSLHNFVKFPTEDKKFFSLTDANWGPQDQSTKPNTNTQQIEIFKSRSLSGYLLWFGGPIHWSSKRQSITARSTTEAEIYATDECVKHLLHTSYLLEDLNLIDEIMPEPTSVLNDNNACVQWSHNCTMKGLQHIQIKENAIRESIQAGFVSIHHVEGKINLADLFTQEDKCVEHFVTIWDRIMNNPAKISPDPGGVEIMVPCITQVTPYSRAYVSINNKVVTII